MPPKTSPTTRDPALILSENSDGSLGQPVQLLFECSAVDGSGDHITDDDYESLGDDSSEEEGSVMESKEDRSCEPTL